MSIRSIPIFAKVSLFVMVPDLWFNDSLCYHLSIQHPVIYSGKMVSWSRCFGFLIEFFEVTCPNCPFGLNITQWQSLTFSCWFWNWHQPPFCSIIHNQSIISPKQGIWRWCFGFWIKIWFATCPPGDLEWNIYQLHYRNVYCSSLNWQKWFFWSIILIPVIIPPKMVIWQWWFWFFYRNFSHNMFAIQIGLKYILVSLAQV